MNRSKHNLSHFRNLTCNMGEIVPIGLVDVLPGDSFRHSTSMLLRTTPLVAPPMHPVHTNIFHIYFPYRILWNDWENFITGGPDGLNASTFPTITVNSGSGFANGSLADYLGVPTGVDDLPVSALPFRAYALGYNHLFRDPDLNSALTVDLTDGADTTTNQTLQVGCWEKDYFTTCRPWTQKGTVLSLPLGSSATVKAQVSRLVTGASPGIQFYHEDDGDPAAADKLLTTGTGGDQEFIYTSGSAGAAANAALYPGNLYADLSTATAATINDLREAIQLQAYKEARALYGSTYPDYLRYLGLSPDDSRMQRPELLASGSNTIQFSEVLQQAPTTSGTPNVGLGNMAGHGVGTVRSNQYTRFFPEHGLVMSLLLVRPKTMYVTGLNRHWSKTTKEDFWQRELEGIGAQEVLNKELYWADTGPNDVFGYQNRYDEYRHHESSVHGDFRGTTLDDWHLGRIFTSDVALNSTFVNCTPSTRIFQSTSTDQLLIMAMHNLVARRMVKKFGTPAKIF